MRGVPVEEAGKKQGEYMLSEYKYPCSNRRLSSLIASFLVLPLAAGSALAQEDGDDESIEEIVTVGSQWVIDAMTTYNASVDYSFETFGDTDARIRLGVVNLTDERASLSTQYFGYMADVNRDLPRSWYLDLRLDF